MKSSITHNKHLKSLLIAILFVMGIAIGSSCSDSKKEFVDISINHEVTPTMKTLNVETLISDSGIIRYKITAPIWLVFEEAAEPRWNFSDGLNLEKYDNDLMIDATFECDSAKYLTQRKLWQFNGNVHALNVAKDRFDTELLFWDQQNKKIYTDSFIHIEKSDRIIEGYGFVSNETMSNYHINRVSGIFPVGDMRNEKNDSSSVEKNDTAKKVIKVETPQPQKTQQAETKKSKERKINQTITPIEFNKSNRAERHNFKRNNSNGN